MKWWSGWVGGMENGVEWRSAGVGLQVAVRAELTDEVLCSALSGRCWWVAVGVRAERMGVLRLASVGSC